MYKTINNRPVEFQRKNVRGIYLRVDKAGNIKVTYPYLVSTSKVIKFVESKDKWIENKLKPTHFYPREELEEKALPILHYWEDKTGLKVSGIRGKDMTTRWGSYSKKTGMVSLNTQLLAYDESCLYYVVLHELAHVKYFDHGPKFKKFLDSYMPNWREARARLH